jgi:arginine decarboxylase
MNESTNGNSVDDRTHLSTVNLYNIQQLRLDVWNRLRESARMLRRLPRRGKETSRLQRACTEAFDFLEQVESYQVFPGSPILRALRQGFDAGQYQLFARRITAIVRALVTATYRKIDLTLASMEDYSGLLDVEQIARSIQARTRREIRPYFEVLLVDELSAEDEADFRTTLRSFRRPEDGFLYEVVVVSTFEDALLAVIMNPDLESCVIRNTFPYPTERHIPVLDSILALLDLERDDLEGMMAGERSLVLGKVIRRLRPEIDLFLATDAPVNEIAGEPTEHYRRIFYQQEDYLDLHLSILKGINERFETPFFDAVRKYSQKPTGMFHALPVSRGRTISKSHWIEDLRRFYGSNLFLAETSATTGGLDSLLQPTGSLKQSQELAARAFGARRTYFVTNGTSTANKIVMEAMVRPRDIVMLAHDCHKSHPYAVILAGAYPVYLDAYPLTEYSMYGGVPLREIKRQLLDLKRAGRLGRVRMLLLTNITFDGMTYDPYRIMEEVLAIKPDMIFLWDEAWFAYGRFSPFLRQRTAMAATERILERWQSAEYREEYRTWKATFDRLDPEDDATWLDQRLLPDPERARARVYATQSTHKTLTALRQGSMIHVHDQDFELRARSAFHEAFMTHTSTSPNYQILASLDVGRRQVELEGYRLVQGCIDLATTLRKRIENDPLLTRYFSVLEPRDMVPAEYRSSGLTTFQEMEEGKVSLEDAWKNDEFVLDPTRVTLHVGRTGMDGDTFKKLLIDRFDIHINKTSRNSLLFLIHIGMTRGTVTHLVNVLTRIARELDDRLHRVNEAEAEAHERAVASLTRELPPLPNFSRFHAAFCPGDGTTPEGDMRKAFFQAYDESTVEFLQLDGSVRDAMKTGREVVSACFVTPYPPGFPILVPGQVYTEAILAYLRALDVKEIHGYDPALGLRVFKQDALAEAESAYASTAKSRI